MAQGETVMTIVGNLTADPELRYTQNGLAVANVTIASTPREFDRQTNEWKDGEALFMRCNAWRDMAENLSKLTKGTRVIAVGRLKQRSYETKEGDKRTVMELEIDEIGPSVRFAVASVQRSQSSRTQQDNRQRQSGGGQQGQDEWAPSAPAAGGTTAYDDETPW